MSFTSALTTGFPKDPIVNIQTTSGRGFTPEEVASRCVDKLMYVSNTAPQEIREQAIAYKTHMEKVITYYMKEAIASHGTTIYNALNDAGRPDLAELIRRL
jgi:hypothetical protein